MKGPRDGTGVARVFVGRFEGVADVQSYRGM